MPNDWGSFFSMICGAIRVVTDAIDELGDQSNEEKAKYAAAKLRDPLDDLIKLPIGFEQLDGPIIEMILVPVFKEVFDMIWPDQA